MPELNAEQKLRYIAEALKNTGDILFLNAQGNPTRLPIGSSGQSLVVSGGVPIWGDASTSYVYPNNDYIQWRNAADSADIDVLKIDANDDTILTADTTKVIKLRPYAGGTGGTTRSFELNASLDTVHTLFYGDDTTNAQVLIIGPKANGSSESRTVYLSGHNNNSQTGGAYITVQSNIAGGEVEIRPGNGAAGNVRIFNPTGGYTWSFSSSGNLSQDPTTGGDLVFNKTSGIIRQATTDGADNKTLIITGGGSSAGDVARGAYVETAGNEHTNAGSVVLRPGSVSGGRVQAYLSNASQFFQVLSDTAAVLFSVSNPGSVALYRTITAGGTTGNQTINKPAGTVNFAAAATTLTVTNSLVDTSSVVIATVLTNDSTALIKNVVCSAGSFVIRLNAAATAETKVGFVVLN